MVQSNFQAWWQTGRARPRLPWVEFARHIYREQNSLADEAAKRSLAQERDFCKRSVAMDWVQDSPPKYIRIYTDGSHRDGIAALGFVVFGA
eukprot:5051885-Karenia_brevis.AAC.1